MMVGIRAVTVKMERNGLMGGGPLETESIGLADG